MNLRDEILESTLEVFNTKGMKFTMDDIAKNLNISKKTIYTVFNDKEEMFMAMVDYLFDNIKQSEAEVLENTNISTIEKVRSILGVMPESYKNVDFRQLYMLRDKYPLIYKKVEQRLENGWDATIQLMEQGMKEGVIRKVNIPIVKLMLESSLEQFFQRDILIQNKITYAEALQEVVNVIVDGIAVR